MLIEEKTVFLFACNLPHYLLAGVQKATIQMSQMLLNAVDVQLVTSVQVLQVIHSCVLKGLTHSMVKQAVFGVQLDLVAYPLMFFPLLVLKDGILQKARLFALSVLLDTTALLLLLLLHLFRVLMDTMLT